MRTDRDGAPLASVDAEDAAQRADHLDQIAGALERWAVREERVAEALPFVEGPDAEMTAREYFERQGGGSP